jgi:hypothetical protein
MLQYAFSTMTDDNRAILAEEIGANRITAGAVTSDDSSAAFDAHKGSTKFFTAAGSSYTGYTELNYVLPDKSAFKIVAVDDGDITKMPWMDVTKDEMSAGAAAIIAKHFLASDGTLMTGVTTGAGPGLVTYRASTLPDITLYSYRKDGEGV